MVSDCLPYALAKTISPLRTIATDAEGTPLEASRVVTMLSTLATSCGVSAWAKTGAAPTSANAVMAVRNKGMMESGKMLKSRDHRGRNIRREAGAYGAPKGSREANAAIFITWDKRREKIANLTGLSWKQCRAHRFGDGA